MKGRMIFIISLFVVMKLVGQTRICVMNDLSGFQNSFSLNLKPGKGEFSACTPCKACFGKGKWRLTNKENEYQLSISIFGYYDTTMTITEKDSFLVINLQERETFNELENNEEGEEMEEQTEENHSQEIKLNNNIDFEEEVGMNPDS